MCFLSLDVDTMIYPPLQQLTNHNPFNLYLPHADYTAATHTHNIHPSTYGKGREARGQYTAYVKGTKKLLKANHIQYALNYLLLE